MPSASASIERPLVRRLLARRDELEHTAFTRIAAIGDAFNTLGPAYKDGLGAALEVAIDYGLAALDICGQETAPVPNELLAQARLAARSGISLEIVLRRYAAGQGLLAEAVLEEAAIGNVGMAQVRDALKSLASRFDRVIAAVGEEYERERTCQDRIGGHQFGAVRDLVAGDGLAALPISYNFDAYHLAIVGSGPCIAEEVSSLAQQLRCELLMTGPDSSSAWAWFGSASPFDAPEFELISSFQWGTGSAAACGENGAGLPGWRISHQQAAAAHLVARRATGGFARYRDVAVLASALQDRLLANSLRQAYLQPLEQGRDQGATAKETLRAYFATSCNVSSAAAALGVHRRTVRSRLAGIEAALGRRVDINCAEIETALRLDELDLWSTPAPPL